MLKYFNEKHGAFPDVTSKCRAVGQVSKNESMPSEIWILLSYLSLSANVD